MNNDAGFSLLLSGLLRSDRGDAATKMILHCGSMGCWPRCHTGRRFRYAALLLYGMMTLCLCGCASSKGGSNIYAEYNHIFEANCYGAILFNNLLPENATTDAMMDALQDSKSDMHENLAILEFYDFLIFLTKKDYTHAYDAISMALSFWPKNVEFQAARVAVARLSCSRNEYEKLRAEFEAPSEASAYARVLSRIVGGEIKRGDAHVALNRRQEAFVDMLFRLVEVDVSK